MEQTRYWMWAKQKHNLSTNFQSSTTTNPSYDDSWEEQAFAEDAAGPHGGCVWPPRSYSCSFCRREFRSAQALGGHMNVHRRDRARLKQSPNSFNEIQHVDNQNQHFPLQNPFPSLGFQYPSQVCNLLCNPNPKIIDPCILPSPSSSSRVSAPSPSTKEYCSEQIFFHPPPIIDQHHESSSISCSQSRSKLSSDKTFHVSDPKSSKGEKKSRVVGSDYDANDDGDYAKADLSVSLNLIVRRTHLSMSDRKKELAARCKRKRSAGHTPLIPFFHKSNVLDIQHVESEVLGLDPCSVDDHLDLELRLGAGGRPRLD